MSKIYVFIGGGQRARQNVELGLQFFYKIDNNSDWPAKNRCSGQSSFTNAIWHEDFESFKRDIEEWAGQKVKLELSDDEEDDRFRS